MLGLSKSISGFDPRSIVGCSLWLDGADGASTSNITSGTWYDKSGYNSTASSNAGGGAFSMGTINGIPAVTFPAASSACFIANAALSSSAGFTVFFVASVSSIASLITRFMCSGGGPSFQVYTTANAFPVGVNTYAVATLSSNSTNILQSVPFIFSCTVGSSVFYEWVNGISNVVSGTTGASITMTSMYIGNIYNAASGYAFTGQMGEVLLYNSVLTTTQRQSVEGYLAWKWGIKPSLPATHPFYSLPAFSRPFGPTDIPGCVMWLDAADTSTLTLSTNNVTQWRDKSGSGNNATQATTSNQPTTGGSQNGLNTLLFTGKMMTYPTLSLSAQTVFCVYLNTTFTPYGWPIHIGPFCFFYAAPSSNVGIGRSGVTDEVLANWYTNGLTTTNYTIYGGTVSVSGSTTSVLYFNGNQVASNTVTSSGGVVNYTIGTLQGGANTVTGYIAEVIVFNSVLGATQRQQVEGYLAAKWGLLNNLPGKTLSPLNIPGCALWYDAADASSITLNGSTVSQWSDKSGNGNHLTQGTTSAQPTYGTYLSYPGVYFNGANTQVLSTTYNQTGTGGRNTFIVFYDISTSPNIYGDPGLMYMGGSAAVGSAWRTQYIATSNALCVDIGAGVKIMTTSPNVTSMRTTRCVAMWAAPNSATVATTYVYGNGTQFTVQGADSGGLTTAVNTVGGLGTTIGKFTTSVISEILHYSTELTASQRQSVENYLMSKWGISNVTTHPFKSIPPSTSQPPQFQEVTPGNWTYDWKPYLQSLAAANSSGVTVTTSTITGGATYITNGWAGGVLGPDGNIYFTPSNAANILKLNVTTGVTTNITGGATYTTGGWCGGVLAPNGNIYFIPQAATNFLVLNPTTGVTSNLTGGATYTSGGWAGGLVGPDGNIYCCPIGATNILKLNVSTGVTTNITGGATYTATGWVCGQVGPDGNIYFTPVYATNILKLDPLTGITTNITGGATIPSNGYRGGTLGLDGNIYSAPYTSANILKFSVSPPTVTTITGGATMSSAWQSGVLAADGNIYFLPNTSSSLIRLNTTTGVTTNITGGATYTSQGWIGGVLAPDGNIYSGPYFSSSILKITFSGLSQLPSLRYCLSPFANHF